MDSAPAPSAETRDYVLEDAGGKELNAIRVLMLVVGVAAIGVNWHARSTAMERIVDAASESRGDIGTFDDSGSQAARSGGSSPWRNPSEAVFVTRRLSLLGMALGVAFLACAAGTGRLPVAATIAALTLCSAAHLLFWAADPLGGNVFFGRIDLSEPNLGVVIKALVAIVLVKAVHTATEYQKAAYFDRANAS